MLLRYLCRHFVYPEVYLSVTPPQNGSCAWSIAIQLTKDISEIRIDGVYIISAFMLLRYLCRHFVYRGVYASLVQSYLQTRCKKNIHIIYKYVYEII